MSTATLPQTGTATYAIDASHSHVGFSVKHMMFATVRGSFSRVEGTIVADYDDPAKSSVEVTIDASSIATGDEKRDAHLRSADFFDVETYPTITFRSTSVEARSDDEFSIEGDLTIRGVTRPVRIQAEFTGTGTNPWGAEVAGFSGKTKIDRKEFGLTWNAALEKGGVLVGDEIKIELEVEATKQ